MRELIPDAFRLVAERLASGSVVLRQDADEGQAIIVIPSDYVRAVCQGIFEVANERGAA